jgi:hypothetical protein
MTRVLVMTIAAEQLFSISGPAIAAHQSRHPSSPHSQGAVKEHRGVVTSPCAWPHVPPYHPRGTSAYPFGPGCNFPYPDRPYEAPGRW